MSDIFGTEVYYACAVIYIHICLERMVGGGGREAIYYVIKTASVFKLPAVNVCVRVCVCVWGVEGGRWGWGGGGETIYIYIKMANVLRLSCVA